MLEGQGLGAPTSELTAQQVLRLVRCCGDLTPIYAHQPAVKLVSLYIISLKVAACTTMLVRTHCAGL